MRNPGAILPKADAVLRKVGIVLSRVSGFVLIGLALIVTTEVVSRFIFNRPLEAIVELGALLLAFIVFLPQAHTLAVEGHPRMTLVTDRMSPRGQLVSAIIAGIVALFIFAWFVHYGWSFFWDSFVIKERMGAEIDLPWWLGKFALPLGFFVLFLQFLINLLLNLTRLARRKEEFAEEREPTRISEAA